MYWFFTGISCPTDPIPLYEFLLLISGDGIAGADGVLRDLVRTSSGVVLSVAAFHAERRACPELVEGGPRRALLTN